MGGISLLDRCFHFGLELSAGRNGWLFAVNRRQAFSEILAGVGDRRT
jgi:hypothetical protein